MRLLDLYCGEGGAAEGYVQAGWEVVGVDANPQPRYRHAFLQADVLSLDLRFLSFFDAFHASPPCQFGTHEMNNDKSRHLNLIPRPGHAAGLRQALCDRERARRAAHTWSTRLADRQMFATSHAHLRRRAFALSRGAAVRDHWGSAPADPGPRRSCPLPTSSAATCGPCSKPYRTGKGTGRTRDFIGEDKPALARVPVGYALGLEHGGMSEAVPPPTPSGSGSRWRGAFEAKMARKNGSHTSTAVMARRRAEDDNEGLSDRERLWKQLDFFATPPWAARAGLKHALELWPQARGLIEPAAGMGHIAEPAREWFAVLASDVHDHGKGYAQRDWLDDGAWSGGCDCDIVVTNPPFTLAEEFIGARAGARPLRGGLLLRLSILEGVERHALLAGPKARLTQVVTFTERVPMTLGSWDPEASSATAYAWFYWSKVHDPLPPAWFGPGTRERLWRPDDAARFGKLSPLPLFPGEPDGVGDVM
jgi:hypothetical protein